MHLKISINLGDFEHISPISNEHDTMEECVRELIKELSKIKHFQIDNFIETYLTPMIFDKPITPEEYKTKTEKIRELDQLIENKEEYIQGLSSQLWGLEEDIRVHSEALKELENKIKSKDTEKCSNCYSGEAFDGLKAFFCLIDNGECPYISNQSRCSSYIKEKEEI